MYMHKIQEASAITVLYVREGGGVQQAPILQL